MKTTLAIVALLVAQMLAVSDAQLPLPTPIAMAIQLLENVRENPVLINFVPIGCIYDSVATVHMVGHAEFEAVHNAVIASGLFSVDVLEGLTRILIETPPFDVLLNERLSECFFPTVDEYY